MKILAICGSPRKGNSYAILNSIKEKYPDIDLKILLLKDLDLQMCRGCYGCVLRGEEFCPLKDDRDMIAEEMLAADGVIVASPTYALQVPALMKNLFDRLGYFAHRPRFFDKYSMAIATGAGYGIDEPPKYINKIFSAFGFNIVSTLELQTLPKKLTSEKREMKIREQTFREFDKFVARIKSGRRDKPSMGLIVVFNLFKAVSEAFPEVWKADHEYYKDKTGYYYDTKIPFYKQMVADKYVKKAMSD